ncbi:MAG: T9SS type A sorting domain-containing protein [Bacteroidia bacterium]
MKRNLLLNTFLVLCCFVFIGTVGAQPYSPSVQASNLQISYKYSSGAAVTLTWARGNGSHCIVVLRKGGSTNNTPPSSTTANFSASASYGSGTSLGSGDNYVVYNGTGTNVYVYNLTPNTSYCAYVYEYNSYSTFGTTYYYNTNTSSGYCFYTLAAPPSNCGSVTGSANITDTTVFLYTSLGNGNGHMLTLAPTSSGYANPSNGYYYYNSLNYGSGAYLSGAYCVYNGFGTNTSGNITGLSGATNYTVRDYEYTNGTYPTYNSYEYNTKNYISCGTYTFNTYNTPPTISAIPSYTICQDASQQAVSISGIGDGSTHETQNLTVTASSSNTTLIPNGNIIVSYSSPNTTGTVYYTPAGGQYGTAVITVTVNDGWSVNNITTRTFTVTVKPKPATPGAIAGSNRICSGTTASYSIAATANTTSYNWSVPSTFTITSGAGTNNITVTSAANYSTNATGNISVYGTNTNGCGAGLSNSLLIQFDAQPSAANAGPDQPLICGTSASLTGNAVPANNTGNWSWYSGTPVPSIGTTTVNSTSISGLTGPNNTYKYVWTLTRTNSVCPAKSDTVAISTDWNNAACSPAANFAYSPTSDVAPTKVCVNTALQFTDLSVSANSWAWDFTYPAGTYTSSAQNPSFTYTATGTYTVHLQIHSNTTGLNYTTNQVITVIGAPAMPSTIFGTNSGICEGSSSQYVYSISSVTDATGYNWTTPPGSDTAAFPSSTSIAVVYPVGSVSGNISVSASNSCGTSAVKTYAITLNPLPNSAGNTIAGPATVCQGQTPVTYSISAISHASSFLWTDMNGTQTNTTNTFTTSIASNAVNGQIYVIGSNGCGTGDTVRLPITVNPLPINNSSTISGISSIGICPTSDSLLFTISPAIANATSYNWTLPSGTSIIGGNGLDSILVNYNNTIAPGNNQISVTGSNGCGTTTASTFTVFVNAPATPQICMVTVDSASTHNIIYWDKTSVTHTDSFRIYREDITNVYTQIGTVHYNSLSEYHDMDPAANPNTTTKRYKISSVDSCGNESQMSLWHNTIYIQDNGAGQFSWTDLYLIEPSTNPVNNYVLMVDSLNNGNFVQIASTAGTQHVLNDIHYSNYAGNANWRVETVWGISCSSTARGGNNGVAATIVKSKSNITNNRGTSVKTTGLNQSSFSVYPNPTNGKFTVTFTRPQYKATIKVTSVLGEEVYSETFSSIEKQVIDLSNYPSGTYLVQIITGDNTVTKRVVKN